MKKYIILFILAFGIASCESFLDVKPKSEILGDKLFETREGFEDALYAVYTDLAKDALYGKVLSWYLPDLLAGYYIKENAGREWELLLTFNYAEAFQRNMFDKIWIDMYKNISYVNNIIQNVENHKDFKYYRFYKGEALGLRAFMHFDLCNCFAPAYREDTRDKPAIPYYETYEPLVYPFRTLEAIYRKVLDDLKEAEVLLQDEPDYLTMDRKGIPGIEVFMTERQYHMNLYAVQGLLARVYQMKNDLDSAMIYAEKVIRSEKFEFADKTNMAYEYASCISAKETIWGIYPKSGYVDELQKCFDYPDDNVNSALLPLNGFWLYPEFNLPEGMGPVDYGFVNLYTVPTSEGRQDYRYNAWFRQREGAVAKHRRFFKIYKNTGDVPTRRGLSMIRIPEMYLIMAEGLLKNGQMTEAREYFDAYTRARGFYFKEGEVTFDMNLINKEYRKEFYGEGREWFNRKRQELPIYPAYYSVLPYPATDEIYVWPVPEGEFEYREGGKEGVYPPVKDEEQNN